MRTSGIYPQAPPCAASIPDVLPLLLAIAGTSPISPTLEDCVGQAETHGGELPTCLEVDGGYRATWSSGFGGGDMSTDGFDAMFTVVVVLIVLSVLIGIATTVWKVSTARRLATESGMDPDVASQMALLTDDGLESTYLASNLRGAKPTDPAAPTPPKVRERLVELKGLLDDGLITQAEHDERRRAILDSV